MKQHLITDSVRKVGSIKQMIRKITQYEEFEGAGLLAWLIKTAGKSNLNDEGANVSIQMQFGIYTDEFLRTYLPNDSLLREKKKGRITIFLVPRRISDNQASITKGDEDTAYELGGLHP